MLQSLLVPLDGSEFSERSLPLARGLAKASGATLHLAHVHVPHPPEHFLSNTQFHYEGLDMEEYDERHRAEEAAYLAEVAERVKGEGGETDSRLLEGQEIAKEVAEYADEVKADMVVITTHAHHGVSRLWLGSVADELVRTTSLPLLVLHPPRGKNVPEEVLAFEHVLVPLDGSDLAASILGPALDLALAMQARMTLLHVVSSTAALGARIFPLLPDDVTPAVKKAQTYLEGVAGELREAGLRVDVRVEEHEIPAKAICQVADEVGADLVALGTHGYGGFKRALLGSVADAVLRGTCRPLLMQRPAD